MSVLVSSTEHVTEHVHPAHTLTAERVDLAYDGRTVVHGLDLDIPEHQVGAIIGPNGCGKSTLLKAFARLLRPAAGRVLLDGRAIGSLPTRKVATMIGLLPQSPIAPEGITIGDLVARGRYPYHRTGLRRGSGGGLRSGSGNRQRESGGWQREDERAMAHALDVTGLGDLADRTLDELSGGQRQRAWIALALAQETDILLLDEPTTFLDIAYQLEVLDLVADLNRSEGVTIVMVLHDLNLAARYSDWVLAMKDGRRVAFGDPREVITRGLVRDVFSVDADVRIDPAMGVPVMTPDSRHSLRGRRLMAERGREGAQKPAEDVTTADGTAGGLRSAEERAVRRSVAEDSIAGERG